jgi:oxygen-independent coproporphyrinogen-3 oxidase
MKGLGVYLDLPFCIQRCSFCAFNIRGYRESEASRYLTALLREIEIAAQDPSVAAAGAVETIYLGGGTPSRYPADDLSRLLRALSHALPFADPVEVSLEAHPATLDRDRLVALREIGIDRLSLGVQSLRDRDLIAMGRRHTSADVERVMKEAREAGFENIGIDLIYGLPDQKISDWEKVLRGAVALDPDHVSIYGLSIEPGTLWGKQAEKGMLSLSCEEEEIAMYCAGQKRLTAAGYEQYEISNYARPGRKCRHNLRYWEGGAYLGLGVSAHSFLFGWRLANTDDRGEYIRAIEAGRRPIAERESVSPSQRAKEEALFGLRRLEGVRWTDLHETLFGAGLRSLVSSGLLVREGERVRLSERGILLADEVAVSLI